MADSDGEFARIMNQAADIFERTWQPAPYPDPRDHPAVLAQEAGSAIGQIVYLNLQGNLGAELKDYQSSTLMDAQDILSELADRIAGDSLPGLLPPWQ
ncbi:hypothetical protein [Citricoccus sp. GCM10030269]|uniref:hypothetical protein n=1 Tax=Citricoccus sp. GCM10030269 TaxID=3273388 RepID=UPI00361616F4